MRKLGRPGDITRPNPFDPLRDVVVQRAGPFADAVLAAFQAPGRFALRLFRPKRLVDLVKMAGARFGAELIRLTARRGVLHLLQFALRTYRLYRLAVPRLRFKPCAALAALLRQVIQHGGSGEREHVSGAVFNAGRALWPSLTEVALVRRGLHAAVIQRGNYYLHGAEGAGHHAGLTANAFLLIDLYAVALFSDGPVRAALRAGCVFTVVAGDGAFSGARRQDRNAGMKMTLAQHVLFTIVRHHAGDFAGAATDALLTAGDNKTIHNNTCFWFNNLILSIVTVFTHSGMATQCSNAQEAELFPVNLWQINFIQEADL